jgi:hypothetical protein
LVSRVRVRVRVICLSSVSRVRVKVRVICLSLVSWVMIRVKARVSVRVITNNPDPKS